VGAAVGWQWDGSGMAVGWRGLWGADTNVCQRILMRHGANDAPRLPRESRPGLQGAVGGVCPRRSQNPTLWGEERGETVRGEYYASRRTHGVQLKFKSFCEKTPSYFYFFER
jgi:hypothetical protein